MARIYVACLASYNNGTLHGTWIDVDAFDDAETIQEQINEMLRQSPYPNVMVKCPECEGSGKDGYSHLLPESKFCSGECAHCNGTGEASSAEEWAIHDHEGCYGLIGEHADLDTICHVVKMTEDHGEAFELYADMVGLEYADETSFLDAYAGEYDSPEDYVRDYWEQCGDVQSPDSHQWWHPANYTDFERMAHDLELSGDMTFCQMQNGTVCAFHTC